MIEIDGVEVWRGRRRVLEVPAVRIDAGLITVVTGRNGAGKSTLLQLVCGHLDRTGGTIRLEGSVVRPEDLRARSALVLQRPCLVRGTALDNVLLALRFRGVSGPQARLRAMEALAAIRADHLADRDARRLSGGEGQRVSVARALALDPDILALDEPFGGLDSETRERLVPELAAATVRPGRMTLVVTHEAADADALGRARLAVVDGLVSGGRVTKSMTGHPPDRIRACCSGSNLQRRSRSSRSIVSMASDADPRGDRRRGPERCSLCRAGRARPAGRGRQSPTRPRVRPRAGSPRAARVRRALAEPGPARSASARVVGAHTLGRRALLLGPRSRTP